MKMRTNMRSSTDDDSALFFSQFRPNCTVKLKGATGRLTTIWASGQVEDDLPTAFRVSLLDGLLIFNLAGAHVTRGLAADLEEFWEVRLPDGDMLTFVLISPAKSGLGG